MPAAAKGNGKGVQCKTVVKEPTRRSTRQQAQTSSVPVSKRATHRLVKAFGMAAAEEKVGDQAMEEYVRSYGAPMTEQRIKAVRLLTSLDSGPAIAAAASLAAEQEMTVADELAA